MPVCKNFASKFEFGVFHFQKFEISLIFLSEWSASIRKMSIFFQVPFRRTHLGGIGFSNCLDGLWPTILEVKIKLKYQQEYYTEIIIFFLDFSQNIL